MVDETRDFIERADSVAVKLHGEPLAADEIARNFALYGLQKRTIALERFESELRGEVDSSPAQSAPARAVDGATQGNGRRSRCATQGETLERANAIPGKSIACGAGHLFEPKHPWAWPQTLYWRKFMK